MAKGQIKPKQDNIDIKQFEALCAIQCTQEEICSVLGCNTDTLNSWCKSRYKVNFSEIFKEKRLGGKASLRRMQWKLAEKNATMGIWLGKQYLGQTDKMVDNDANEAINNAKEILVKIREVADVRINN